ncbi:hypothetical protein JAAARDRAFT_117991 [Jaapia argillacea MUCL 33604]|uniref:RRM domain-containing protein n=1 Tax=Jaapia argillacea MUCL 33604 TaxID=933084 RepID=A0A067QNB5_9AGAM|nr:hypothetical protein JAAARDRAFT_117991 [Jaapia argillacea MUCL 33604]
MSEKQTLPTTLAGFTVLPIVYSPTSTHVLYARRHETSKNSRSKTQSTLPSGRTVFLVNIPPFATEREMVLFFKPFGVVERVVFDWEGVDAREAEPDSSDEEVEEMEEELEQPQPRKKRKLVKEEKKTAPVVVPLPTRPLRTLRKSGGSAHVVFLDASSVDRALAQPIKPRPWPAVPEEPSGLAHYRAQYDALRPPLDVVRQHADTYMDLFDYELAKGRQKSTYKKGEAIVDEDGFTLVTRGGAYGQTVGGGVGVASKKFQETGETSKRKRKKKEAKEKETFYAFQKHEKNRKGLMDLQKKWEEDKAKVEKLKASKRFKPY